MLISLPSQQLGGEARTSHPAITARGSDVASVGRRAWADEDQARAEDLRAEGWSYEAIGRELGWGSDVVQYHLPPRQAERRKQARWRKIQRHCPDAAKGQLVLGWQL